MQTLYQTFGGWVLRGCSDSLATQEITQFGTKRFWCAKSSNPVLKEGKNDGLGVTVDQRDGFTPSSETMHTSQEETVPS